MSELWEACEFAASYLMFGGKPHGGTQRSEHQRRAWLPLFLADRARLRELLRVLAGRRAS